jgi:alkylated DNA repair dioxygenase AlkB
MDRNPEGFRYLPEFLSSDEERALLEHVAAAPYREIRMRGQIARRRTAHYGWDYGYESWQVTPTTPIPDWLLPVRERAAALVPLDPAAFEEVLLTEYPPGSGIGWHRDALMFGDAVVGVSLGGACRMRFRREDETAVIELAPRSAYVLAGAARKLWQHSIPAVKELRYSITFRTLRSETRSARAGTPRSSRRPRRSAPES